MLDTVIRSFYDYNAWANARVLDSARHLTPQQLVAPGGTSSDSVRETLVHTMHAQWLYLERWQGRSPRSWPDQTYADLAGIRAR